MIFFISFVHNQGANQFPFSCKLFIFVTFHYNKMTTYLKKLTFNAVWFLNIDRFL